MSCRALVAASAAAAFSLIAFGAPVSAGRVIFDSLDSANSGVAYTAIDPIMAATFNTGASPVRVHIALMLSAPFPEDGGPHDTYTVSLDGGVPLSDLSFDPTFGLNYLNGPPVDFAGPVIKPVQFSVASLKPTLTIERFDQFEEVSLNPNSLYWIEVSRKGVSEIDWGITHDVSGAGVAGNYMAWFQTDDGFFLNRGVYPYAVDDALQMEIDVVPDPPTWLLMALGFAGLGFFARAAVRGAATA
jgi:hypothetical protein